MTTMTTKLDDFTISIDGTVKITLFSDVYSDRGQTSPISYVTNIDQLQAVIDAYKELKFSASIF